MSLKKVRVLYDFTAEDSNELTTHTGETLTVINPNVFEGWMEVRNSSGSQGIVPTTYVQYLTSNDSDDDIPPPPSSTYGFSTNVPSWSMPAPASSYVNQTSYSNNIPTQIPNNQSLSFDNFTDSNLTQTQNNFTDDWDAFAQNQITNTNNTTDSDNKVPDISVAVSFDDSTFSSNQTYVNQPVSNTQPRNNRSYEDDDSDFSDDENSANTTNNSAINQSNSFSNNTNLRHNSSVNSGNFNAANPGTISRVKSKNSYGLDVFLLHGAVKNVLDSDKFSSIILNELRQSVWKRISPPYQVSIIGYHSDKKYGGVKKFTCYDIQAKIFPQVVKRRYNHFDWLHERLVEKYPNICIPPLPGKAVTGNFEDEFISKRKAQLELWLNKMSSHPVVGQSEVFVHFLQCDDTSSKWKAGKRKAEKDEYRGSQWFCTLTVPGESVDTPPGIKERVDKFAKASGNLDHTVKNVSSTLEKIASLNSNTFKKEYCGLGKRLEELGLALNNEALDAQNNAALATALVTAGNTYVQIGNIYGEQAKTDINPLLDHLQLYRGIIQQMPDIVQFEKNAIQTFEEFQAKPEKLEGRSLMEVAPRREIISHVTFAEINLFNKNKVDDFSQYMKTFLQQQIGFYKEITKCLEKAYSDFEKIPTTSGNVNYNQTNRR